MHFFSLGVGENGNIARRALALLFLLSFAICGVTRAEDRAERLAQLDRRFLAIEVEEGGLEIEAKRLADKGVTAPEIMAQLKNLSGDPLTAYLRTKDAEIKAFHQKLDTFNLKKLDYLIDKFLFVAEEAVAKVGPELKEAARAKLDASLEKLRGEYRAYQDARGLFGQPKDVVRVRAYQQFFQSMYRFRDEVNTALSTPGEKLTATAKRWINTAAELSSTLVTFGYLCPDLGIVSARLAQADKPTRIYSPLLRSFYRLMERWAELNDMSVTIEGKLPPAPAGKEIQIVAFEHGDGMVNHVVRSKMNLGRYAFVGAADQMYLGPLTDWVTRQLDRSDQYVVVGRGSGQPIEKIVKLASEGGVRRFVISPEGTASAGTGETRPVREKFSSGLIDRLRAEGFKVTIVPVSLPNNYGPPGLWADSRHARIFRRHLKAVLHEPITPEMLDALAATGDPGAMTRLLRETWHSARVTDKDKLIGMPRLRQLETAVHRFIGGPDHCRHWMALVHKLHAR